MAAWADGGANDICPPGFSVPTEDFKSLKWIVSKVNVKLISTTLPTSEPSKAALTLTVSTVLLVIVAV
jgi:hypothetical protein